MNKGNRTIETARFLWQMKHWTDSLQRNKLWVLTALRLVPAIWVREGVLGENTSSGIQYSPSQKEQVTVAISRKGNWVVGGKDQRDTYCSLYTLLYLLSFESCAYITYSKK